MASRSLKVRRVFAELRGAIGPGVPAGELLRLAVALVDATLSHEREKGLREKLPQLAFDLVPLDKAYADGGWGIMSGEARWADEASWDDDPYTAVTRARRMKVEMAA